jgi:hypothetical protein
MFFISFLWIYIWRMHGCMFDLFLMERSIYVATGEVKVYYVATGEVKVYLSCGLVSLTALTSSPRDNSGATRAAAAQEPTVATTSGRRHRRSIRSGGGQRRHRKKVCGRSFILPPLSSTPILFPCQLRLDPCTWDACHADQGPLWPDPASVAVSLAVGRPMAVGPEATPGPTMAGRGWSSAAAVLLLLRLTDMASAWRPGGPDESPRRVWPSTDERRGEPHALLLDAAPGQACWRGG